MILVFLISRSLQTSCSMTEQASQYLHRLLVDPTSTPSKASHRQKASAMESPAQYAPLSMWTPKVDSFCRFSDVPPEVRILVWRQLAQDSIITVLPMRHAKYRPHDGRRPDLTEIWTLKLLNRDVTTIVYNTFSNDLRPAVLDVQGPASHLLAISRQFWPDVLYALHTYATYNLPYPRGIVHLPHPNMAKLVQKLSINAHTFACANWTDIFDFITYFPSVKHIALTVNVTWTPLTRSGYYQEADTVEETKAHIDDWSRQRGGNNFAALMPWRFKSYRDGLDRVIQLYFLQAAQGKKINMGWGRDRQQLYSGYRAPGERPHPRYVAKV